MNFLFLMDPLDAIQRAKDTTFALMAGARARGHNVYYLPKDGLSLLNGKLRFRVQQVFPQTQGQAAFKKNQWTTLQAQEVDRLFIRTDPPFDEEYLTHTWLLDFLPQDIPVINSPRGIRTVNEKIWLSQFSEFTPSTLVTRQKQEFLEFWSEEKNIVAKPANGYGGQSIFLSF